MARHPALHDRIANSILESAAEVLAQHGESASMARIAEAAGVSRATLYRYFPNREALIHGLIAAAITDLSDRIAAADLDVVPVREGLARLTRGFVAAGSKYAVLARGATNEPTIQEHKKDATEIAELDRNVAQPIRDLINRGIGDSSLRGDLPADVLFELFIGMLERILLLAARGEIGTERAAAAVTAVFFDGAAG